MQLPTLTNPSTKQLFKGLRPLRSTLLGLAATLVTFNTTVGCGAPSETTEDSSSLGTLEDELVVIPNAQPQEFKYFAAMPVLSNAIGDGAMCTPSMEHSRISFSRDTTGYVYGDSNLGGSQGSWGKYGSPQPSRRLGGDPACGFLTTTDFIILAKGANAPPVSGTGPGAVDKRLFWSKGSWSPVFLPPPPAVGTPWAALDQTQYSTNGNPAVATHDGGLVVVYLNDSGKVVANFWDAAHNTFSAAVSGPTAPSGWTVIGTPALAFVEGWLQKYMVVARATDGTGKVALFATYIVQNKFVDATGGSQVAFRQLTLPSGAPAIQSDPAIEYDPGLMGSTLYYRNGTTLYQVSADVNNFSASKVKAITLGAGTAAVSGNPSVIGGVADERGKHWIMSRGNGADKNLYFGTSYDDEVLTLN